MDIWNDFILPELLMAAKGDRDYQKMLAENRFLEDDYSKVMDRLSEAERECMDSYIASCENLGYRLAQLAYELGASSDK
ncbi:MAG: hypothetical protein IKJ99_09000 [Oscillospiraceae bacterium]|nr:hypothetical protein [Oscillospiraceae bacterium]